MARVIVASVLTTTAAGTRVEVCSYTVPPGKKFILKVIGCGGEPTTWSTTEASLGYVYPGVNSTDFRGMEVRNMQGDATGVNIQYLIVPIPGGIEFTAGEKIGIYCDPAGTTSSRWKGIIIGDEVTA